jgi:hypothetical protein
MSCPRVLILTILIATRGHTQIADPIPASISESGLALELVDFVEIPASSASKPLARINLLREAPDASGRLFVNDLRGTLHVIKDGIR